MSVRQNGSVIAGGGTKDMLTQKNITNCITETPQDIKLELVGTTLTLKAGSKVYMPNGFEADGVTRKFDIITVADDITYNAVWGTAEQLMITVDSTGTSLIRTALNRCTSGTTAPTETNYRWWYDLNANLIKVYSGGSYQNTNVPFPIAIVAVPGDNTAKVTKIDYMFNGFGIMGTTRFLLPGLSGLVSDGFNADGSYKNVKFTNPSVYIYDAPTSPKRAFGVTINVSGNITNIVNVRESAINTGTAFNRPTTVADTFDWYYYAIDENNWYYTGGSTTANWQKFYPFIIGIASGSPTLAFYRPDSSFCALDRNSTDFITHQVMPAARRTSLTLGSSGASYTAPDDGYICLEKVTNGSNQYVRITGTSYQRVLCMAPTSGSYVSFFVPVVKGQTFTINYTAGGTTNVFNFVHLVGSKI